MSHLHRKRSSLELVYEAGDLDGVYSKAEKPFTPNPKHLDGVPDMSSLIYLEEPNVLHNLKCRYDKNEIYTSISKILVAVNPYQRLPIYGAEHVAMYNRASRITRAGLPPHVFNVSEDAYQNVVKTGLNQSLVVCGESGSGKTESAKLLMRYLAESTQSAKTDDEVSIEEQVLQANPILEAFGNAKTVLNNNSSRFGKFTKVLFRRSTQKEMHIVGSFIETYLLEKSRVCRQDPGERNYHIFYQLNSRGAASYNKRLKLGMDGTDDWGYLSQGNVVIDGVSDAEIFQEVVTAMGILQFDEQEVDDIFRVVAGVCHLGNVAFELKDALDPEHSEVLVAQHSDCVLDQISALFGCNKDKLRQRLTTRSITVRGNVLHKPLNPRTASSNRDSISKAIYDGLFQWVVRRINRELFKSDSLASDELFWIGILDVFGFESFENNSFEQFCINFCNERLQQYFNSHVIKSEQEEYQREAIFWEPIEIPDNRDTIDLISGRNGIISLLDSACLMPKGSHEHFTQSLFKFHKGNSRLKTAKAIRPRGKSVVSPSSRNSRGRGSIAVINGFAITHYAGVVVYNAVEFLAKNEDSTHPDTKELFASSTSAVCRDIFSSDEPVAVNLSMHRQRRMSAVDMFAPAKQGRARNQSMVTRSRTESIGNKFQGLGKTFAKQLEALMSTLQQTTPYFVRCVNPNSIKQKQFFDPDYVRPQLRCGGLIEALRILKCGYPTRLRYDDLYSRYGHVLQPAPRHLNERDFAEAVLLAFGTERKHYQPGLTKVFFRAGKQEVLENILQAGPEDMTPARIGKIRKFLLEKKFTRLRGALKAFLNLHTKLRSKRALKKMQDTAGVVIVLSKGILSVAKKVKRREATKVLQAVVRTAIAENNLLVRKECVVQLQKWYRHAKPKRALYLELEKRIEAKRGAMAEQEKMAAVQRSGVITKLAFEYRQWMEKTLKLTMEGEFFTALQDGIMLCKLVQALDKGSTVKVHKKAKPGSFFAKDNINHFIAACKNAGVEQRFLPDDLTERQNVKAVVICMLGLARAFSDKVAPPPSVQYEKQKGFVLADVVDVIEEQEAAGNLPGVGRSRRRSMVGGNMATAIASNHHKTIAHLLQPGESVLIPYLEPEVLLQRQAAAQKAEEVKAKPAPSASGTKPKKNGTLLRRRRKSRAELLDPAPLMPGKDPKLDKIRDLLKSNNIAQSEDPEAAIRYLIERNAKLAEDLKHKEEPKEEVKKEEPKTGLPQTAAKDGGQWDDANHMFFFMTALSCKMTCKGPGRNTPTADLYRKAMDLKVPFQFYKDWILRELNRKKKKKRRRRKKENGDEVTETETEA